MTSTFLFVAAAVLGFGALGVGVFYFRLWLQAWASGAQIGLLPLMLMSLRKVDPAVIVRCKVMATQAGLDELATNLVEAQFLAGGNVLQVTLALIAAHRSHIELDWNTAAAIDLAGRDILEAVRVSVNPKVIYCPDPQWGGSSLLSGVAKDGIQVHVRARVTVRTNLAALIGGATEATVVARVGQGIISAIGGCDSYLDALSDPLMISRKLIVDGLDSETAFAIVSIDIAEIAVGQNLGARLQIDQAEADLRVARAGAEQRRTMAIARLQEMHALTREREAALVLAEADIPSALAQAFLDGPLHMHRSRHSDRGAPPDDRERASPNRQSRFTGTADRQRTRV